jgi:hypothetical protein
MGTIPTTYSNSLDPAAVRRAPARTRPGIVPVTPKAAPAPPPTSRSRSLFICAVALFFVVNIGFGIGIVRGVSSLVEANETMEQDSIKLTEKKERAAFLRRIKDGKSKYVREMGKQNEHSPILLNEARERTNVQFPGERVMNLREEL